MNGKRVASGLEVSAFRLARHHLAGKVPAEPSAICHDVCGIQAQVMSAAEIALWARNHELARPAIHSALWESRTLVKTALMRGTLHLVAARDFPLYIAALRTSRVRQALQIMARYGVSENDARAVGEAVIEMLRGGPMTRRDLTKQVLALGIAGKKARPWFEQSSWGVFRLPMTEGLVCYGPSRGQEVALVRTDQWLGGQKQVGEQEAVRILIRRYLSAYGPADSRDFSKWSGLPASEVRPIWHSLDKASCFVKMRKRWGIETRSAACCACCRALTPFCWVISKSNIWWRHATTSGSFETNGGFHLRSSSMAGSSGLGQLLVGRRTLSLASSRSRNCRSPIARGSKRKWKAWRGFSRRPTKSN